MIEMMKRAKDRLFGGLAGGRRRGSILIFALGILAILSIISVGYVTVVRIDRGSAAAVNRQANYQQQVDAVVGHIKSLIAADLFGNKIADRTTRRESLGRAFEDGECWDFPTVDEPDASNRGYTFNTSDANERASDNSKITFESSSSVTRSPFGYFPAARPDDAWLASVEPAWMSPIPNNSDETRWPQITNLRSGYTYNTDGNRPNTRDHYWERGDGRYADLGRFFSDSRNVSGGEFGNAGTDLLMRSFPPVLSNELGPAGGTSIPFSTKHTQVYRDQMANLSEPLDEFTASDERYWADTDGDRRPDARWTQLDSLGNLYGLVWVTAARIVDASALVNVNTAVDFWTDAPQGVDPKYGDGRTPADVDLFRLLTGYQQDARTDNYFINLRTDRVRTAYNERVQDGLGITQRFVSELTNGAHPEAPVNNQRKAVLEAMPVITAPGSGEDLETYIPPPVGNYTSLTRNQRAAFYELGALALENPVSPFADHYEVRDLYDLAAYWGTNEERVLSKLEQHIDGPLDGGYLPGTTSNEPLVGPMRARETAVGARGWSVTDNQKQPTQQQMKFSARRLLTTVSGVGSASPVPVLNEQVGSKSILSKINLRDLSPARASRDVPRMFDALVWALGPFVTDMPVMSNSRNLSTGASRASGDPLVHAGQIDPEYMSTVCYGGSSVPSSASSPVVFEETSRGEGQGTGTGTGVAATHAVFTAASLAANIQDAGDGDNVPTVVRFVRDRVTHDDPNTLGTIELGRRLPQGDIPITPVSSNQLPEDYFGVRDISAGSQTQGTQMTFVGLERQPFITEVVTGAWYSTASADFPGSTPSADDDRNIDGTDPDNQLGSMVVVEVFNPWDEPVVIDSDLTNSFMFVIPFSEDSLIDGSGAGDPLTDSMIFKLPNAEIAPGALHRFVYINGRDDGAWLDEGFEDALRGQYVGTGMDLISDQDEDINHVIFNDFIEPSGGQYRPMLLMREIEGNMYLIDRMVPDPDSSALPMPAGIDAMFPIGPPAIGGGPPIVFSNIAGQVDGVYFQNLGYPPSVTTDDRYLAVNGDITGRVSYIASMRRPSTAKSAPDGGFPASVLAFNGQILNDSDPLKHEIVLNRDVNVWLSPVDRTGTSTDPIATVTDLETIALHLVDDQTVGAVALPDTHILSRSNMGSLAKSNDGLVNANTFPGFQLKTPRGGLAGADEDGFISLSELHEVCIYAHMCANNELANLKAWTTVSEQLANAIDPNYGDVYPLSGGPHNPSLGVLDSTRYIPGSDIATGDHDGSLGYDLEDTLPDSMRIPLAHRVFDVFDALPRRKSGRGRGDLQMGRVNINTAPPEVLMLLPMVAPDRAISDAIAVLPMEGSAYPEDADRVAAIMAYRGDTTGLGATVFSSPTFDEPAEMTRLKHPGLAGVSTLREEAFGFSKRRSYGFASIGELATLHEFDTASSGVPFAVPMNPTGGASYWGFQSMGADTYPTPIYTGKVHPLDLTPSAFAEYDPLDDAEERLAQFRAVANIATQRSDVYLAWFVVRGYSPDVIEQIPAGGSGNTAVEAAMNRPEFRPAYESRWLAVLDRSNVRTPLDRPEVLMLVELPSTSP